MKTRDCESRAGSQVFLSMQNQLRAETIPSLSSPPYTKAGCFSAIRQATPQPINSKPDYCLLNSYWKSPVTTEKPQNEVYKI